MRRTWYPGTKGHNVQVTVTWGRPWAFGLWFHPSSTLQVAFGPAYLLIYWG